MRRPRLLLIAPLLAGALFACDGDKDGCEVVAEEYGLELDRVQACETDEDCGVPLPGTGCGCDDNLVGAADADTEQLYYILQLGQDLQCDIAPEQGGDDCECGAPVGHYCDGDGFCAWSYEEA